MKAYLLVTSIVFGLVALAHVWRSVVEPHVVREIPFLLLTLLAAGLCVWGLQLFFRSSRG